MAIVHRISSGRHVLLSDHRQEAADAAAKLLENAGFETTAMQADVSDRNSIQAVIRKAQELGQIKALVQVAGVSPSQAFIEAILKVDLYGISMLLEEFGRVIAKGGLGVVISSQSGYRMPALTAAQDALLATAPADDLLALDFVKNVESTLHACNSLRVRGEAVRWPSAARRSIRSARHHREAAGARRTAWRTRGLLPGDAEEDASRTRRYAGRSGWADHGAGRRLYHWQ